MKEEDFNVIKKRKEGEKKRRRTEREEGLNVSEGNGKQKKNIKAKLGETETDEED